MTTGNENTITDTNDGFIVGADPKEPPRTTAEWGNIDSEVSLSQQPVVVTDQVAPTDGRDERFFTSEDIERVRREEKDKLYDRISSMDEQLKSLAAEREERERAEEAARQEAETLRRQKEEETMEVRDLLERREQEFNERINEIQETYERDRALFEQEKRLMELDQYRQAIVDQNAEYIMPELRDLIRGNTEQEIESSVEEMRNRTAIIMQNMTEAATQQRQSMRGVAPTAPPVGPMENSAEYQSLSPEDIRTMDMETYRKYRDRLIPAASQAYRRGGM
jgi:DNA repair exonuclease SbcCD ATPase subunit